MGFSDIFAGIGQAASSSFGTGIGSGLASGLINNIFNGPRKQLINQKKLMDHQAKINKDLFDYQYEKELPSVRRRQLEEAGLNPALMYSGSGVSGMNAQIGHSSGMQAPQLDLMTNSNPLATAQVGNIEADTKKKEQETKTEEKNTLLKQIEVLQAEYNLDEISPARKKQILQEIEESQARIRNLDKDTDLKGSQKTLTDAKLFTELMEQKWKPEQYKADINLKNAQSWRENINALFEKNHGYTMSANGGLNGAINRLVQGFFGTHEFQDWIQAVRSNEGNERNFINQLWKTFQEIFKDDYTVLDYAWPLASLIYRIVKANA